jgi:NDP-sugar pyrophosphorylase family protein
MRAIILAGGKGTRLRPYTTVIPKPIVPVGGMAIMEILIRKLVTDGCDHITVAVNHQAQIIMAYFGDGSKWGVNIDYSIEDRPLNTIGPLKLIENLPENFLVMNGDILTDLNFGDFYKSHIKSSAMGTIATFKREAKIDFGVLTYDESEKRITEFKEKPVNHYSVSMGIYAFSKKILNIVPDNTPFGFDELMIKMISNKNDLKAYPFEGYWLDIGRPDDYDRANEVFQNLKSYFLGSPV